ncbi:M23 family metallopeptidase [Corynebacterium kroppenstedtii]|uniref:M23 family metallopeptidase n=1 Tax=Corynebacterium sp. PCR 32 TaxID=3351342 RepID=UPI0030B60934
MQTNRGSDYVGTHRRQATPKARRVASVAVAAGALSTTGAIGAGAATLGHSNGVRLVADADAAPVETAAESSPQILQLPQTKPVANFRDQIAKTVEFNKQRVAADAAARKPEPKAQFVSASLNNFGVVRPAHGTLTTGFEMRWGSFHKGIDIANALGTPEYAVMDSTVISAGPASGFGQWVRLRADDGTVFVYGHMETINVSVGQRVKAGDVIAGMGSRGFSTGSHCHFEVHLNGSQPIDPLPWLAAHGIDLGPIQR